MSGINFFSFSPDGKKDTNIFVYPLALIDSVCDADTVHRDIVHKQSS